MSEQALLSDAPGCVGSPVLRNSDHEVCKQCTWRSFCAKLASKNAVLLAQELGVDPKIFERRGESTRHRATPRKIAEGAVSAKSQKLLDTMASRGLTPDVVKRHIESGDLKEVTAKLPTYAGLILNALQARPLTRAEIQQRLQNDLTWGAMTAQSHMSIFIGAFRHIGAIAQDGDKLKLEIQ